MTRLPDDQALTDVGVPAATEGQRILLIACGAIARETLAVIEANGWQHVAIACLPAILHNHPERIVPAMRELVARHRPNYQQIFVLYADCGTGGQLFDLCKELGLEMLPGPHCYSFFEGTQAFARRAEDEIAAFYLTDFLVRQFDAFVWKPLGLDRHPELRDAYFGNYEKLVYQAQVDDPALDRLAQSHAKRLGLDYERRLTGYGDLATTLKGWLG